MSVQRLTVASSAKRAEAYGNKLGSLSLVIRSKYVIFISLLLVVVIVWGFSGSYSSHNIDNIVHIVALGIDKSDDNSIKVSFQFVNVSSGSGSEGSSGGENSTVVTSIKSSSLNKAINLMNSYIGKELNFDTAKIVIIFQQTI